LLESSTHIARNKEDNFFKKTAWLFTLSLLATYITFSLNSCDNTAGQSTANIPKAPVNITIDLNLPSYMHLASPGSYMYLEGGVTGVILVHDFDDAWYAFERACPYDPLNDCSRIWGDSVELNLRCGKFVNGKFTSCCDSKFNFAGFPLQGKARTRLAQYYVDRSSNIIQIVN